MRAQLGRVLQHGARKGGARFGGMGKEGVGRGAAGVSLDRSRGALGRDLISGTPTQDGVRMATCVEQVPFYEKPNSTTADVCLCTNSVDETNSPKVP